MGPQFIYTLVTFVNCNRVSLLVERLDEYKRKICAMHVNLPSYVCPS